MKQMEWQKVGKKIVTAVVGLCAMCILLSMLMGFLVIKEILGPELSRGVVRVLGLAALFGICWSLARSVPSKRLLVSEAAAGLTVLVAVIIKALFLGGENFNWQGLLIALCVGTLAGVCASGKKTKRR